MRAALRRGHPGCLAAAPLRTPTSSLPIRRTDETMLVDRLEVQAHEVRTEWRWQAGFSNGAGLSAIILTTMNIRGSHLHVSASIRGLVGFRPMESKKALYRRMKEGLLILYRVQLCVSPLMTRYQSRGATHSISLEVSTSQLYTTVSLTHLKYSSTRPSAILLPGTPAMTHSR